MERIDIIETLRLMSVKRENEHDIWFNGEYLGTIVVYKENGFTFYKAEHEYTETFERHISFEGALDSYADFAIDIVENEPEQTVFIVSTTETPEQTIWGAIKSLFGGKNA